MLTHIFVSFAVEFDPFVPFAPVPEPVPEPVPGPVPEPDPEPVPAPEPFLCKNLGGGGMQSSSVTHKSVSTSVKLNLENN